MLLKKLHGRLGLAGGRFQIKFDLFKLGQVGTGLVDFLLQRLDHGFFLMELPFELMNFLGFFAHGLVVLLSHLGFAESFVFFELVVGALPVLRSQSNLRIKFHHMRHLVLQAQ